MKILNVIVYYNNPDEVLSYINEVGKISDGLVDIVIVNNGTADTMFHEMQDALSMRTFDFVSVIDYGENVGYLNALLKTVEAKEIDAYDFIILSNTDIMYSSPAFFRVLSQKKYELDIGCIAPSVVAAATNSYSNPHLLQRVSLKKLKRNRWLFRHHRLAGYYVWLAGKKSGIKRQSKENSMFVYAPHGCYMIFTNEFIKRIRGYQYGAKMYSEEACIGELLRRHNMKCFYDAEIEVTHMESLVTGKINQSKRFAMWSFSYDYIIQEFYEG